MAVFVAEQRFSDLEWSDRIYTIIYDYGTSNQVNLDTPFQGVDGESYPDHHIFTGTVAEDYPGSVTEPGAYEFVLAGDLTYDEGLEITTGTVNYFGLVAEEGGPQVYATGLDLDYNVATIFLSNIFGPPDPFLNEALKGDDQILLSAFDDHMLAGSGADTVSGGDGCDTLLGNEGDDEIHTGGNDGQGGDTIYDHAYGGAGDDILFARSGRELVSGHDETVEDGSGRDTVSFAETDGGVTVSLALAGIQAVRAGHIVELVSIENLAGSSHNDVLTGSDSENAVFGGEGEDTLDGAGGEDLLDGGSGIDTALYHGDRADFTIGDIEIGRSVAEVGDPNEIDALASIERIEFDDGALVFDIDSENVSFAYRIYAAAYGRTPDEAGLRFWTDVLDDRGDGPPTDADKEFIAGFFLTADEYISKYGENPTNEEFINKLYENVLHREADQAGYDFWLGVIASGQGKDDLLIWFTDSNENLENTAPDLDNGVWVL
jgi:Ca2+-binding RTX toxin-like protein